MAVRLRSDLHCCLCDGRMIFLDLAEDRYFALPADSDAAFLRLAGGEYEDGDVDILNPLFVRGLLVEAPGALPITLAPSVITPVGDLADDIRRGPRLADVLGLLLSELRIARSLRKRALLRLVQAAGRGPSRAAPRSHLLHDRLQRLAAAASRSSFFLRATDRCLVRALAMQSRCKRLGIASQLVFGVRTNPFGAHCWVQHEDRVLIGDYQEVRLFTPILVVG